MVRFGNLAFQLGSDEVKISGLVVSYSACAINEYSIKNVVYLK